ncbi:MAG TPA: glutathione peroxidase [Gammaproteobacteria bacterium]
MRLPALLTCALLLLPAPGPAVAAGEGAQACPETLDFSFRRLGSAEGVRLCDAFRGKLLLVVNTASRCGYTYQYAGLEQLYARYRERGLVVAGFPSNDFGGQEPGSEEQISEFCRSTYDVKFPMFEKTRAAPGRSHPFYDRLAAGGHGHPQWNFHKYLLDREGRVVASWRSGVEPTDPRIVAEIERLL